MGNCDVYDQGQNICICLAKLALCLIVCSKNILEAKECNQVKTENIEDAKGFFQGWSLVRAKLQACQ